MSGSPEVGGLARAATAIDAVIDAIGRAVSWFSAAVVVLMIAIVALRYGFDRGSVALQEAVLYLHSAVFLLGAAWALKMNAHVRVDIFYQRWSSRGKAIADLVGTVLFLLPFCGLLVWLSWDYAAASWAIHEGSREPGGLPYVYVLKSLIPAAGVLLIVQGIAQALRAVAVIGGGSAVRPSGNAHGGGA
jgi:TRAP-type mannitol/chloroaromatic compound transport system permease small subunit